MRYLSLFSGIEAASVAWEPLGWEPIAFCEVDRFPSAVLAHRFPDVPNLGDITQVDWKEFNEHYGPIDIIVGGSPCQSFSIAAGANRTGLAGKSNLMFEYIRAIAGVRPRWLLWENVPGVLNVRDNAFAQLLDELQKLGYGLAWRVLNAEFFDVAQRRKRVFLVGCLNHGGGAAAVLFNAKSVCGAAESEKAHRRQVVSSTGRKRPEASIMCMTNTTSHAAMDENLAGTLLARGGEPPIVFLPEVVGTLTAHYAKGLCVDDLFEGLIICEKQSR